MKVIIDRFEGEYAVVETDLGKYVNIPKVLLPKAKEGDTIKIEIDKEDTNKRKEHIGELLDNLFED